MRILVLGMGNTLLGDDGVGVHALDALASSMRPRSDVELLDGGTLTFTLASALEACDSLIVVDAAQLGAAPGTVCVLEDVAMDDFVSSGHRASVHEVSLADLLALTALTHGLPSHRALVGVQPMCIEWSDSPTPAVVAALPRVCHEVEQLIERWSL